MHFSNMLQSLLPNGYLLAYADLRCKRRLIESGPGEPTFPDVLRLTETGRIRMSMSNEEVLGAAGKQLLNWSRADLVHSLSFCVREILRGQDNHKSTHATGLFRQEAAKLDTIKQKLSPYQGPRTYRYDSFEGWLM